MGDKCEGVGLMIVGPRGAKTVMACKPQEISLSRKQQQCVCASKTIWVEKLYKSSASETT